MTGSAIIDTALLKTSIITFAVVIISLTVHEVSHGFVSYLLGDKTAKNMGRLTLNPIKHLDPIGALCMFLFHFGWAKPVPINPNNYRHFRLGTVIVSFAGPLSNLILSFGGTIAYTYFATQGFLENQLTADFLTTFIILNIGLAVFNLIPISPLDGSKILLAFLPEKAYRRVLRLERYGFILIVILSALGFLSGFIDGGINFILERFLNLSLMIVL